jgi:long-chain acyl-CoA synthetase
MSVFMVIAAVAAVLGMTLSAKVATDNIGFKLLGTVLVVIDALLWVVTLGPIVTLYRWAKARTVFATAVSAVDINGAGKPQSQVWRSVDAIDKGHLVKTPQEGVDTAIALLTQACSKYADQPAQGIRPLLRWKKDEGYRFPAKEFGPTEWRTFKEMGDMAKAFGAGLRALGAEPQPDNAASEDHKGILIYDDTAAEWMVANIGAQMHSIVVATAYATLGVSSVQQVVVQGGVKVIVCNRKSVEDVKKMLPQMPTVKAIVYTNALCTVDESQSKVEAIPGGPQVISFDEALELGKSKPCAPVTAKPSSIAVLMYTSGSTGDPKGVMVNQGNLLAMISAVNVQFGMVYPDGGGFSYIGYLPLAHILELAAESYMLCMGHKVGYSDPKSLLGGPERAYPNGGLDEFKPQLMAGVPKVWEGIKAGAEAKVKKAGALALFLINTAVTQKAWAAWQRRDTPLFNVLLKKFKATTGGNLKACLSGGGAISAEVQEWVRTALGCPLVQGYGLTETCGGATLQMYDDPSIGIAGTPMASVEIALHSEPEITDGESKPYLTTDTVHSDGRACAGRGEVWIRGTNVTAGYYKMPQLTEEEFDANGWFHTGDIGLLTPSGQLCIIDRKKNLVKLKGGEYVALEKMNTAYNNSPFVAVENGGVCCQADDSLDRAVCVAQCKAEMLTQTAESLGIKFSDVAELQTNAGIQDKILESFKAEAKKAGLTVLETVVGVYPLLDPWSPANGCLTATQKLVPKTVWKHNKAEFEVIRKKGIK